MTKTKARVLLTMTCGRNCDGCCNKDTELPRPIPITSLKELNLYEEINLTGGDPALFPEETLKVIRALRKSRGHELKIYLYTSSVMQNEYYDRYINSPYQSLNGIQHTLHEDAKDKDIMDLYRLSDIMLGVRARKGPLFSSRLAIDKILYEKYDFSNIDFSGWSVVRKLVWLEHCPLPEGETLFFYDMNKFIGLEELI